MHPYELLLAEYEDLLYIEEREMISDGLYADGCIWIRSNMTANKKYCVLAEEIGHYETSFGDILDQSDNENVREERKARVWAYGKVLPLSTILRAAEDGYTQLYELAEYLNVEELFLRDALIHYRLLDA